MDGELGTPESDQRARRVEASGRARRMLSPPPIPRPQLTQLWEGAVGPIQETGQHARVSSQTMSCLSQAAVPGAGCAPEDAPSAVSPINAPSPLPLWPSSKCYPPRQCQRLSTQGWGKGSLCC